MTVILNMADGGTQVLESTNFAIVPEQMANPFIVKIRVYNNNGKKIATWKRKNARAYMKNFVPPATVEHEEPEIEVAGTEAEPAEEQTVEVCKEKAEPTPEQTENA